MALSPRSHHLLHPVISRNEALARYADLERRRLFAERGIALGVLGISAAVLLNWATASRVQPLLVASAIDLTVGVWTLSAAKREAAELLAVLSSSDCGR